MRFFRRVRRVSASSLGSSAVAASHSSRRALRLPRPFLSLAALRPALTLASSSSSACLALWIGALPFLPAWASTFAGTGFGCALLSLAAALTATRTAALAGAAFFDSGRFALCGTRGARTAFAFFAAGRAAAGLLAFRLLIALAFFLAARACLTLRLRLSLTILTS